ncbi:hypothetical protein GE061_006370 [Apolygus lucorum]|uniref:MOB kinase activator-like 2 n=1 Tax=Apolygus lucorum TaxID=248454 RepID=A0A8S9WT02_APOLU|nr:hypothetical protein GE061_006370 [Apolygus lucorum]
MPFLYPGFRREVTDPNRSSPIIGRGGVHFKVSRPLQIANEFPSSFESIVRKILRLLFHVMAHVYHCHFREVVLLNLHAHLNCLFAHIILFNARFQLIDSHETEILSDLVSALKLLEPPEPPAPEGAAAPEAPAPAQ